MKYSCLLTIVWVLLEVSSASAQNILVSQGQISVPVFRERLSQAREEALYKVKKNAVFQILSNFLDESTLTQASALIQESLLKKPDTYIESMRTIQEKISTDGKEFSITIEARIFRTQIINNLKSLYLPIKNYPVTTRRLVFLYNPQTDWGQETVMPVLLQNLRRAFATYKILVSMTLPITSENITPSGYLKLTEGPEATTIDGYVMWDMSPEEFPKNNKTTSFKGTLKVFTPDKGKYVGKISTAKTMEWTQSPDDVLSALMEQITLNWTSLIGQIMGLKQDNGELVLLRFYGLPGPQEEVSFVRQVFYAQPDWQQVQLDTVSSVYTDYRGYYRGKPEHLESFFKSLQKENFRVERVSRDDPYWNLYINWLEAPRILIPYTPDPLVENLLKPAPSEITTPETPPVKPLVPPEPSDAMDLAGPTLQVPNASAKSIYQLPLNQKTYDHIKSKGDSTLFLLQAPSGTRLKILWRRLGKTNLRPSISFYDEERVLLQKFMVSAKDHYEIEFPLGENQSRVYLKVADAEGFIDGLIGSFQFFRYLLEIRMVE
ncbi:MAG: hypothetical protein HQM12_06365 [SAR324 cluster bacterium]|nr:hypothetical protein [SAR324 cluster bacterium]